MAHVTHAALLYCSSTMQPNDWPLILRRIASGTAEAAVALENAAEAVTEAAVSAARKLPGGQEVSPATAVALLWRLTHTPASEKAAEAIEVIHSAALQVCTVSYPMFLEHDVWPRRFETLQYTANLQKQYYAIRHGHTLPGLALEMATEH